MKLIGRCSSCQSQFKVDDVQAGKTLKCPKCAGPLVVPPLGAAVPLSETASFPAKSPEKPVEKSSRPAVASPFVATPQNRPVAKPSATAPSQPQSTSATRPPIAKEAVPPNPPESEADSESATDGEDHSFDFLGTPSASSLLKSKPVASGPVIHSAKKKNNKPLIIVACSVALLAVCVGGAFLALRKNDDSKKVAENTPKAKTETTITIDISPDERKSTDLVLDDSRTSMPADGPVEIKVKPGRHKVVLRRTGFLAAEKTIAVKANTEEKFVPTWERIAEPIVKTNTGKPVVATDEILPGKIADWTQDIDAALKKAAADDKDVLVVFMESDDNDGTAMRYDLLENDNFQKHIGKDFVCVLIDLADRPKNLRVENKERNRRAFHRYGMGSFGPSITLLDSKGAAFGRVPYEASQDYFYILPRIRDDRSERDRLFKAVEDSQGEARLKSAVAAIEWLKKKSLEGEYLEQMKTWRTLAEEADPKNAKGVQDIFIESLIKARLRAAMASSKPKVELESALKDFEEWKKKTPFKDPDLAVRLHLGLASILGEFELGDLAAKVIEGAMAYTPTDDSLKKALDRFKDGMVGLRGSGSGFVAAEGGYVLTNHHVVKGAKRIAIRIPNFEKPVPADLIGTDEKRDIALLKVKLPEGVELGLSPLHMFADSIDQGVDVAAFGFPLGSMLGNNVKLTTGIISSLPDKTNEDRYLLNVTVNPGNSGGPLCDQRGFVVGMVTAKTGRFDGNDTYGLATPTKDLRAFLKKHIPSYAPKDKEAAKIQPGKWVDVSKGVAPSVLMILNFGG